MVSMVLKNTNMCFTLCVVGGHGRHRLEYPAQLRGTFRFNLKQEMRRLYFTSYKGKLSLWALASPGEAEKTVRLIVRLKGAPYELSTVTVEEVEQGFLFKFREEEI